MKRLFVVLVMLFLSACGGGCGGDSASSATGGGSNAAGTSNFKITYTDVTDMNGISILPGLDYYSKWYVENPDGSLRGPFDSKGTGTVDLGQDARATANVTYKEGDGFYATYVGLPVQPFSYYTGDRAGVSSMRLILQNSGGIGEFELNTPYRSWNSVTADPFTLTVSSVFPDEVLGNDNLAGIFVSYRISSAQEPSTLYDFKLDLPWSGIGSQTFDVGTMKSYSLKSWASADDLSGAVPYIIAQRKGLLFPDIGRGISDAGGTAGKVGFPSLFPADNWYLASGAFNPTVVAKFDPAGTSPITLKPLDRYIEASSIRVNPVNRTVAVNVLPAPGKPGTDPIHFGVLHLSKAGTINWDIYFPWSAVINGVLNLPALPDHPTLPGFDFVQIDAYRLDGRSTVNSMFLYSLDRKGYPFPSYAMDSKFSFQ